MQSLAGARPFLESEIDLIQWAAARARRSEKKRWSPMERMRTFESLLRDLSRSKRVE
jgi:nicotinamide mononucleotide adenylyltransferase